MTPTDEQTHILNQVQTTDSNLLLSALAGCGKTSTLELIERATKTKPILYLVFNKRNAKEAEDRMLSTTTVRTFNALGHRVWAKACIKNLTLNPRKSQDLLREIINESPKKTQSALWEVYWEVIHGVALAKALGYVPEGKYPTAKRLCTQTTLHLALDERPDDLTSDLIDATLTRSIALAYEGNIDYNDQIYMPGLFGGTFPRFPLVMVDEAQDLNPVNHAMLEKLAKHRLVVVGDPWQSIYQFRGAMQGSMEALKGRYKATKCDLSISFRCPKAIVENVHWRVPHFKYIKAGGHVETLQRLSVHDIREESTIICRNNAPLFRCAMHLLAGGRSVSVAGSEIGPKLLGIMRKLGDSETNQASVLSSIEDWRAEKLTKESTTANDLADCMKVFAGFGSTLGQAISYAEHLFAQKGTIRLLTGHKAKGLEWNTVIHLDPWLIGDSEQELNLKYVIATRSMDRYYEVDSRNIQW